MKTFLQNLLIFFALALCGLISFQWVRETQLRKDVQALTDSVHDKAQRIIDLEANVKRDETEIQRLDGLKNQLTQTVKTNEATIDLLGRSLDKATNELDRAQHQIEVYKDAMQTANDNIKRQNDEIKQQNEEIAKIAEERNEMVKKFNKMAADFNELANKWNKQQEELAKAATNAPAKK
jgi:chromosome segregation ATPase